MSVGMLLAPAASAGGWAAGLSVACLSAARSCSTPTVQFLACYARSLILLLFSLCYFALLMADPRKAGAPYLANLLSC